MKKFLALLLALLMVVPMMVFTTSATETPPLPTTEFIPIVTEDNMPSADADNATLESQLWNGVKWNGTGKSDQTIAYDNGSKAVYYNINGVAAGSYGFVLDSFHTDITGATSLCFDLYISDVEDAKVTSAIWKVELAGFTADGTAVSASVNNATLQALSGTTLVDGWNHISIPLTQFADGNAFTMTTFSRFTLYNKNADVGVANETTTFKLKNIYFLKEKAVDLSFTSSALSKGPTANAENKAGAIKHYGFNTTTMDISDMTTMSFVVYIPSAWASQAADVAWRLQLYAVNANDASSSYAATVATKSLAEWCGGKVVGNAWHLIEVPITSFASTGASWDATKFTGFRFYNNATFTPTADGSMVMRKVRLTQEASFEKNTLPALMATDLNNLSADDKANVGNWHRGDDAAYPQYGTYGTKFNAAGIKYDDASAGVKTALTGVCENDIGYKMTWGGQLTLATVSTLCFDFYISDLAVANAANVDWRIRLEYAQSKKSDLVGTLESLAAMSGYELKAGWNHFELPLAAFNDAGANKSLALWQLYIGIYDSNDVAGRDGEPLTVMIRDIYFKKAPGVAKIASAQLSLTDSFNLTYKVEADANIVCKPLVELTYGNSTTRQTLKADGSFDFNDIFAHRLADTITTTVTALDKNGEIVKNTHTYSVMDYCKNMLAKESVNNHSAEQLTALKRLLSDMLYYGAAAQTYANYNVENLASNVSGIVPNENVGENFVIPASTLSGRPSGEYSGTGPKWRGATLVLDSAMCIRYSFTADNIEDVTIECTYDGADSPIILDAFVKAFDASGNPYYYVDLPVYAYEFDTVFTVSFAGVEGYDLDYSVNHYLATKHDPSMIKTSALLEAIYNYGVSAKNYVTAMQSAE